MTFCFSSKENKCSRKRRRKSEGRERRGKEEEIKEEKTKEEDERRRKDEESGHHKEQQGLRGGAHILINDLPISFPVDHIQHGVQKSVLDLVVSCNVVTKQRQTQVIHCGHIMVNHIHTILS
jgi:hypothetical protein